MNNSEMCGMVTFELLYNLHLKAPEILNQFFVWYSSSERQPARRESWIEGQRTFLSIQEAILQRCNMRLSKMRHGNKTPVVKVDHSQGLTQLDLKDSYTCAE